jgi:hypothetical protein
MPGTELAAAQPQYQYGLLPDQERTTLETLAKTNPGLAKDPMALNALASQYKTDSVSIAHALGWANYQNSIHNAHNQGLLPSIGNFFGGLGQVAGKVGQGIEGLGDAIGGAARGYWDLWSNPSQTEKIPKGWVAGVKNAGQLAKNWWQSAQRPISPGQALSQDWNTIRQLPMLPAHQYAFTASMIHKHGLAYYLALALYFGGLTDSAAATTLGEGESAFSMDALAQNAVNADKQLVSNAEQLLSKNSNDFGLHAEIKAAQERLAVNDPQWLVDQAAKDNWAVKAGDVSIQPQAQWEKDLIDSAQAKAAERVAQQADPQVFNISKSANVARAISDAATKAGFIVPLKAITGAVRLAGGYGANASYLATMALAQGNPDTAKLWADTANGTVYDEYGRPITLGADVANMLGQKDTMFFSPIAFSTDFISKFVINDPITKALEIPKIAKSWHGFTGTLGQWYGGLGIRGAGDISRAYYQYSSVRRAIDYIATHNAAQILDTFRNTFSPKVVGLLAKAKTPQEVLSVLEDISEGVQIVGSRAPTLGWYSTFKTALRGQLGERFGTLGNLVASDEIITKKLAEEVEKQTGYDITQNSLQLGKADVATKTKLIWRRRLAGLFTRTPVWRDEETGNLTNQVIRVGSVDSIPAMMDFAKSIGMPQDVINAFGDHLYNASQLGSEAYVRAYRQLLYEGIMRNVGAKMPYAETEILHNTLSDFVWQQVDKISGVDGGGLQGAYVASKEDLLNEVLTPNGIKRAGIGDTHLGSLRLPSRTDFMRLNRTIGELVSNKSSREMLVTLLKTNTEYKTLVDAAETSGLGLTDVISRIKGMSETTATETLAEREIVSKGFKVQADQIYKRIDRIMKGGELKGLTEAEKYANIVKYLENKVAIITRQFTREQENFEQLLPLTSAMKRKVPYLNFRQARELGLTGVTFDEWSRGAALDHLEGEHMAVQQIAAEFKAAISTSIDSLESIKKLASQIGSQSAASAEAKEAYVTKFISDWEKKTESSVRLLGKRGARNNKDIIVDISQMYLNKFFKPLSLTSPGWAERVSLSEVMLNALRTGPFHFFESYISEAFAKRLIMLDEIAGKGADGMSLARKERNLLKNVVGGVLLGFDEAILKAFDSDRLRRLTQDAIDVIVANDGHLPMGIHSQHDSITSESMQDMASGKVWGINASGDPEMSSQIRGDKYTQIHNNNSAAGTALFENLSRVHNDRILAPVGKKAHELMETVGKKAFEGEAGHQRLLNALEETAYNHLRSLPEDYIARFERSKYLSAVDSTGDPLRDWAKVIAEHVSNLGTGERGYVLHPEMFEQMATGGFYSPRDLAKWLSDGLKKGKSMPNYFPAQEFISPYTAGSRFNLLVKASDKIHSTILGPMVNMMSRDPMYVLEYHNEMEKLRPFIASNIYTEEEAQTLAMSAATINMSKMVHNPLDKTIYESNMRVLAPYYFAKNQALRRAFRMAGENPAAFEKYLKINLAITNYISQINAGIKNGTFAVPGGEMTTAIVGSFLNWYTSLEGAGVSSSLAGQFGLDASPTSSAMSVIVTGNTAGWKGFFQNFWQIPYSPIVTFPAKAFYEYATHHNPHVYNMLSMLLGKDLMQTSAVSELMPNTLIRNTINLGVGLGLPNSTNAFVSLNHYVVNDMMDQLAYKYYKEVTKQYPQWNQGTLGSSGAGWAMVEFYVSQKISQYMSVPGNAQKFQDQANARTALMYGFKTLMSYSLPVSVNIGQRFAINNEFSVIMKEKNADGTLKYPTYFQALDEFTKRHPDHIFDLIAHTKSPTATYPETTATFNWLKSTKNQELARQYPYAMAFVIDQGAYQYDPRSYQTEMNLGLRQRETKQEYMDAINVKLGDLMYSALQKKYLDMGGKYVDPATKGLSYEGVKALDDEMKSYGQIYNITWLADHNGGRRNNVAYQAYQQMKQAIKDPNADSAFSPGAKDFFKQVIELRDGYDKMYSEAVANGQSTGKLKSEWYNFCQAAATNPAYAAYSSFFTSVLLKLPNPQ